MKLLGFTAALVMTTGAAMADMSVKLGGGWDGRKVPAGQHCRLHGGNGATPPMRVTGVPQGARWIVADYNDKSYKPLSQNGGHGRIAYPVKGATTDLPPLPGMTARLPGGAKVVKAARGTGKYASPGYLPPCSGGKGNRYTVDLRAVNANGKTLAMIRNVDIGRY
ncbi:hypothetical protein D6850_09600 [Roseovarius spongiae]|uniref:Uncharacterized protein n=1 Tax=Roseovarius spongiae TaxID=2320272 RepID=A0A3A8AVF9_9RHOB|nr:hypothetical protein [Roseovarius spongiae]RKF15098.1 hypothetical protein D6850_09600 [Roseovarius spongiae]